MAKMASTEEKQTPVGQLDKSRTFEGKRETFDGFRGDEDLAWFIVSSGAEMGEKGTLAGVVSVLELGGVPSGGVPNTDLYSDAQIGWRTTVVGSVERHRWLSAAWQLVAKGTQGTLLACYMAPPARFRTDQGFGARDVSPSVEAIQRGAVEPQHGRHQETRTGVEAQLGQLATLAFQLTENPAQLLQACQQPSKGKNGRTIRRALRLARDAAKEAHVEWGKAKADAQKPRHWRDRKAILEPFVPHDPHAEVE
jgi:hypothetical protein